MVLDASGGMLGFCLVVVLFNEVFQSYIYFYFSHLLQFLRFFTCLSL